MPFASAALRKQLDDHRRRQNEAWAALAADERLQILLDLRHFVREAHGAEPATTSDEPPGQWALMLERRRALRLRDVGQG